MDDKQALSCDTVKLGQLNRIKFINALRLPHHFGD